ncbi:MAG TPA: hypothetical protein VKA57_13270 [Solirubrobacteraceae bacterium]|nr:hypothetical protein [Solirubrobacteraceae bacterium]
MKAINDIWRQLVGRRLLPVAIILAAALVAVPFALGKDSAEAPAPNLLPVDENAAAATKTVVSLATPSTKRRAVLGSKTNPFLGEKLPKAKKAKAAKKSTSQAPDAATGGSSPDTPVSGGGGSVPFTPVAPVTPTAPKHRYERYDLTVRFGDATSDSLERGTLSLLDPLPSADEAVIAYVDVSNDGKSAVFMLDEGVVANGDGECRGDTNECETVRLKAGETEFFDVMDELGNVAASYQLDVIKIHRAGDASAVAARAARAAKAARAARGRVAATVSAGVPAAY